jgi:hypothetical protein
VARARNTGMRYSSSGLTLEDPGTAPLLLEPVVAAITIKGAAEISINALDINGFRTDRFLKHQGGTFAIDGGVFETLYYEVRRG